MKKTIACVAMIASATAFAKTEKAPTDRKPSNESGYTFAGCRPAYAFHQGNDEYKNDCNVPMQFVKVDAIGMVRPGTKVDVLACDEKHVVVVSSTPINFRCLPPGVVEL